MRERRIAIATESRAVLVDTSAALKSAAADLAGAGTYYLDTEFDRPRAFGNGRLCLLQISRGETVYLIDTLKVGALEPLAAAVSRLDVEWVLHDGGQDLDWLGDALKMRARPRVFDTQVAWGLLGIEYPVSLAYLLYRILGIRALKEFQAGDWVSRPLSEGQVQYAADDVRHLPALRQWMAERLAPSGRMEILHEACAETTAPEEPEPVTLEGFRNAWQLDSAGQAALRWLIDWYNSLPLAERRDVPHPRMFLTLAKLLPESGAEMMKIRGLSWDWVKRHGDSFAGKLMLATIGEEAKSMKPLEPPPYETRERLRAEGFLRNAAAEECVELGVAPGLAFPERLIRAMAKAVAETGSKQIAAEHLVGWRARILKERLLARLGR